MNLLFFDIECASVSRSLAKICAFGYVLCDGGFNVLEEEDILINPHGGFHLTNNSGERGLVLPYEYADFKRFPIFPKVYDRIRDLLENRDNMVVGHAIQNDVKYLNLETRRYRLPPFRFRYYDTQLIYMTMIGDFSRQLGLGSIAQNLNVEYTPHRAVDDAYATMRIAEAMCRSNGCDFPELQRRLGIAAGSISSRGVTLPTSRDQIAQMERHAEMKAERSRARILFYERLSRERRKDGGPLSGVAYTFSRRLEDDAERGIRMLDYVYAHGGVYSQKLEDCDVYVCDDGDDSGRTDSARRTEGISIITPEELMETTDG